jgi:hypothetical protein
MIGAYSLTVLLVSVLPASVEPASVEVSAGFVPPALPGCQDWNTDGREKW